MSYRQIILGEVEPITAYVVDDNGLPLAGLSDLYVRLYRQSDAQFFDWADQTFKASGHTTLNALLSEVGANAPGLYELAGGFNSSSATNLSPSENLVILPIQTPGTNARLPSPEELQVRPFATGLIGARQITITVDDGAVGIPESVVDIYDAANAVFIARLRTDPSGDVVAALDDATYRLRIHKAGYVFSVPETLVVTADASVTFSGTAFAAPAPSAPNLCVIFGWVDNAAGIPIGGACVEALAETPQSVGGFQKSERVASTLTDTSGAFQIELVRTASVLFRITDPEGQVLFEEVKTVPDVASQDLETWP